MASVSPKFCSSSTVWCPSKLYLLPYHNDSQVRYARATKSSMSKFRVMRRNTLKKHLKWTTLTFNKKSTYKWYHHDITRCMVSHLLEVWMNATSAIEPLHLYKRWTVLRKCNISSRKAFQNLFQLRLAVVSNVLSILIQQSRVSAWISGGERFQPQIYILTSRLAQWLQMSLLKQLVLGINVN